MRETKISRTLIRVSCLCDRVSCAESAYGFVLVQESECRATWLGFRACARDRPSRSLVTVSLLVRARERERLLSRARASFSDGDLFVKNEDLMLEDIWRRGDCESGAVGNTVRGLHCDEEGRCW